MRPFVRGAIVAALTSLELIFAVPDLIRPLQPIGDLGFSAITSDVTGVVPGGPAQRAGIKVGDVIGFPTQEVRFRWFDPSGASFITVRPGDSATVSILQGDQHRPVTLIADTFDEYPAWFAVLRVVIETFWVLLAAFLVLRIPNVLTWSFFVFSLFPNISPMALGPLILPLPLVVLHHVAFQTFSAVVPSAAIAFITSLGAHPLPRWRRTAAIVFISIFTALNLPILVQNFLWYFWAIPHSVLDFSTTTAYGMVSVLWGLVALALLGVIYAQSRGQDRMRIAWVLVGFTFYAVANAAVALLPPSTPLEIYAILWTTYGVLPICVAYSILKHRLIDVNFFVSRALVYAIISSSIIVFLGLIDWFFSKKLSDQKLSVYAQVLAAIAIGFWFRDLQRRVDHIVDSLFFRRKHHAEQHLLRLAKALPNATSHVAIARALVDEPFVALGLASAALYEKRESRFLRIHERGAPSAKLSDLNGDDIRLLSLRSDSDASEIDDTFALKHQLAPGPNRPDVALPIFVRGALVAIALYGAHDGGEHLDADEVQTLVALAAGTATGYAHLSVKKLRHAHESAKREAERATVETELLRRENAILRESLLSAPQSTGA